MNMLMWVGVALMLAAVPLVGGYFVLVLLMWLVQIGDANLEEAPTLKEYLGHEREFWVKVWRKLW